MTRVFRTLVEMFERVSSMHATRPAIGEKQGDRWSWIPYDALRKMVDQCRGGLAQLGVGAGDRVAIVSNNRLEWAVMAYATYGRGAAIVPLYEAQKPAEWEFILKDSGAKVAFVGTEAIASDLRVRRAELPALEHVIVAGAATRPDVGYDELLETGGRAPVPESQPGEEELASLIYTSGTTGNPKGVLLSHRNVTSNINAVHALFPFSEEDRTLSFIPWAHAFGHTCELHTVLSFGASIGINDSLARLPANLGEVKPTIFVAVPRIFNKMFTRIHAQMDERKPALRHLFEAGVRGAQRRNRGETASIAERLALLVADPLIFAKVRRTLGGRLRYAISGGAALAPEVAELIQALGITVYEGYGLTETSPLVAANHPGHAKIGSVGKLVPGVSLRIDKGTDPVARDGELIVFGPNVMMGYHHRPEEQAAVFTEDGGLKTGDLGYLDDDGFLHITGRIKEQYKLENGKYVVPVPLEEQLQLSPYIANAMIHGANRPYNVALIALEVEAVKSWAKDEGVTTHDFSTDPRIRKLISEEIASRSAAFKEYERPRGFVITTEDFTPDNDMLTPSLKLRRKNVLARYGEALEGLYRSASAA